MVSLMAFNECDGIFGTSYNIAFENLVTFYQRYSFTKLVDANQKLLNDAYPLLKVFSPKARLKNFNPNMTENLSV